MQNIKTFIRNSIEAKERMLYDESLLGVLESVIEVTVEAYRSGNKVLAAGNGGSAADAQHFVAELVGRFYYDRRALAAITLSADTSVLTAVSNDYGYDSVFSRQVEAHGQAGDLFYGFSTSGNSANILKALEMAKMKGLVCIGLTGSRPSRMESLCDYILKAPSEDTPRIQECQALMYHIICQRVEETLFPK